MKLRYALGLLVALFALLTLFDRFVLIELLVRRAGVPFLLAGATAAASIGFGALVRRATPVDLAIDFLVGYPIFGTACFLAGLAMVNILTMSAVVLIGIALAAWLMFRAPGITLRATLRTPPATLSIVAIAAVLACGIVAAQAPPASLDELAYHLAIPRAWVLEGRTVELPLLSVSYFPLGIESADLPALTLLGGASAGIASHFLHLFAALAAMLVIARRTASWLATAAIATTPALAITAGWSLVDWPLLGLFVVLFVALESDDPETASAATAAGLLTKYTFAPFALIAWALKRRLPRWTALLGLVFFVRNLFLTWNPFAPFFSANAPHVSGFRTVALADYIFEGTFVDEALGASLIALAPFTGGLVAVAALATALLLFLFLAPSARILVPFLAIGAITAAPDLHRRVLKIVVATAVVLQTFLVVWFTARAGPFALLAGTITDEQYVAKSRVAQPAISWLNQTLPPDSRTLVIGVGETFWFTRRVRGGGNFDGPRISSYFELPTPEAVRERLRRDGITHVAVVAVPPTTKVAQKREERQTSLSPAAQRMLSQMLDRYAGMVTSRGPATVFALK